MDDSRDNGFPGGTRAVCLHDLQAILGIAMNIMILGVSGFIGRYLYHALEREGHRMTGCSRDEVADINWHILSFEQDPDEWIEQLQGIDVVINAVGVYRQTNSQRFSDIHTLGPSKLFEACHKLHIRVIQISAIGAEQEQPATEFLSSKRAADQYLLQSDIANVVLYPGIVLGEDGRTTRQLSLLARLPCIPLVFNRETKLPLISIYQLSKHIVGIIDNWPRSRQQQVLVARSETVEQMLTNLRRWMGLDKARFIYIPKILTRLGFFLFPRLSIGAFNKQSMKMLSTYEKTGHHAITEETASISLITNKASTAFIKSLGMRTLYYLNLSTLSLIWVVSGISSIISIEQSRELIASVGVTGVAGDSIIYSGAIADIVLGILLWLASIRRPVIYLQIGVMLSYSIIISLYIPTYWLHPFAPVIKNLAMFMLALYLLSEEDI